MKRQGRIVYSTETGRHCPDCGKPVAKCSCNAGAPPRGDGIVRLQRQTKGRNGKPVVIITGLGLPADELKQLASRLKSRCACGGTVEDGNIVIQGDKRDIIRAELEAMEFKVK